MNIDEANRMVSEIREIESPFDAEQHELEDDLRHKVLVEIATNSTDPTSKSLALKALETSEIKFGRWYE